MKQTLIRFSFSAKRLLRLNPLISSEVSLRAIFLPGNSIICRSRSETAGLEAKPGSAFALPGCC
jgi:hypothetical protein